MLTAYVLALMLATSPDASVHDSLHQTAEEIAEECQASNAFASPEECASAVVAVARFESSFRRWVVGDGGHSFGLLQIHDSNFRSLGICRDDAIAPRLNIRAWLRLVARSPREWPLARRLAFGLMTRQQATYRAHLADRLLRSHDHT